MNKIEPIMCRISALFSLLFLIQTGYAQSPKNTVQVTVTLHDTLFTETRTQPEFPGGFSAMNDYLRQKVHYPSAAAQAGIKGMILVSFLIDTTGNLTNIRVLKGLGFGCDEEALRAVRSMPRWIPGTESGKAVPIKYNLPIRFPHK